MKSSTHTQIEEILTSTLAPIELVVNDDSQSHAGHKEAMKAPHKGHYSVYIKSAAFANKSMVQQHRLVYDALSSIMTDHIHALALTTKAPY